MPTATSNALQTAHAERLEPALYSRFEDERTRPAAVLLPRVPLDAPQQVLNLGCGPSNSTELLVERFPLAQVVGHRQLADHTGHGRQRLPQSRFEQGNIADWTPADPVNLAYANASLLWVSDHQRLLPRLLSALAPGGVPAVQNCQKHADLVGACPTLPDVDHQAREPFLVSRQNHVNGGCVTAMRT